MPNVLEFPRSPHAVRLRPSYNAGGVSLERTSGEKDDLSPVLVHKELPNLEFSVFRQDVAPLLLLEAAGSLGRQPDRRRAPFTLGARHGREIEKARRQARREMARHERNGLMLPRGGWWRKGEQRGRVRLSRVVGTRRWADRVASVRQATRWWC